MVNDRDVLGCSPAIVARKQDRPRPIRQFSRRSMPIDHLLKATQTARRPNEATKIRKSPLEKYLDDLCADEAVGSRHEDSISRSGQIVDIHCDRKFSKRRQNAKLFASVSNGALEPGQRAVISSGFAPRQRTRRLCLREGTWLWIIHRDKVKNKIERMQGLEKRIGVAEKE